MTLVKILSLINFLLVFQALYKLVTKDYKKESVVPRVEDNSGLSKLNKRLYAVS
jgi:hypothetical protein